MTAVDPLDVPAASPLGVVCAACDHPNPPGARFCNACGSPVHHAQCPYCEAINDGGAERCYKCQNVLRSTAGGPAPPEPTTAAEGASARGDPEMSRASPEADIAPTATPVAESATPLTATEKPAEATPPTSDQGSAVSASDEPTFVPRVEKTDAPVHYMGMLTAPADEAELDRADLAADRRARRARKVRYAAAALLILPPFIAGTFYALEHQDKVDALVEYTRVAVVAPLVRAASSVLDSQRNPEPNPESPPSAPEPARPATPGGENTIGPSSPAAQSHDTAPHEPAHAADANSDTSAANTAR